MNQPAATDPQYPAQRAFVVQIGGQSDVAHGLFVGRVEHVASGEVTHFHAPEELLAFIGRVLTQSRLAP
ncbi:MAG: hypothetical protein ACREJV_01125 [Candidatus Rokuibacteriota bacterium]